MTELELKSFLKENFPKENENCDWKEYKNLKNSINGSEGDDLVSYVSAISNMEGGNIILGIEDKTLKIIGIARNIKPKTKPSSAPLYKYCRAVISGIK